MTEEEIEEQAEEYKNKLAQEHYDYYLLDFAKMCFKEGAKWRMKKVMKKEKKMKYKTKDEEIKALRKHIKQLSRRIKHFNTEENFRENAVKNIKKIYPVQDVGNAYCNWLESIEKYNLPTDEFGECMFILGFITNAWKNNRTVTITMSGTGEYPLSFATKN